MIMATTGLFLLLSVVFLHCATAEYRFWFRCSDDNGNFTANSTYAANLNLLLTSLSSQTHPTGFSNFTFGSVPDRISGLALCQGDVAPADCHSCVLTAASDAPQLCPYRKAVNIWYNRCHLRYSNEDILSSMDSTVIQILYNAQTVDSPELDRFNRSVVSLLEKLADYAAWNSTSPRLFAAGEIAYRSSEYPRLYGMVQCTRNIDAADCRLCLQELIKAHLRCCTDRIGKRLIAGSCTFGCEISSFFNWTVELSYPPVNSLVQNPSPSLSPSPSPSPAGVPGNQEKVPPPPPTPVPGKKKNKKATIILLVSIVLGLAITLFLSIACIGFLKRRFKSRKTDNLCSDDFISTESLLFNWEMINRATNSFSESNKLGEGGYGLVYKGVLPDGKEVAIKRPHSGSLRGVEQLKNEVLLLAKLQHRNLVQLYGVCIQDEEKLLVYEFVANGSLGDVLFDQRRKQQLKWDQRYRIIVGIARGLQYLHEESHVKIIHRDLKASNVLLDAEMNPKISDFGTARLFTEDQSHASTNTVAGTFGYMAPEYLTRGHFSDKLDVFSFGVLILEIVTGLRNVDFISSAISKNLLAHVWEHLSSGSMQDIIDPSLGGNFQEHEVARCTKIGLLCVQERPADRPTMSSVVIMLHADSTTASIRIPNRPNFPGAYNIIIHRPPADPTKISDNGLSNITELDPR